MITKPIVLLDLDGTLIRGQSQIHLLYFMFMRGQIDISTFASVIIWYLKYKLIKAEIDSDLATKVYKKFITGLSVREMHNLIDALFDEVLLEKVNVPVLERVQGLMSDGYRVILVSASLSPIVQKVFEYFKFDDFTATELEIKGNIYTGNLVGAINEGVVKKNKLIRLIGTTKSDGFALTDSESDIAIFDLVTHPIVVSPNTRLQILAKNHGWEIIKS